MQVPNTEATATRKRLSVAQNPGSAAKKGHSAKTAAKRTNQADAIAGNVPNAFDLMLQSDFSVDFMGSNPLMFSQDLKDKALSPQPLVPVKQEEPAPKKS